VQVSSYDYVVVSRVAECYTITHSLFMTIFGSEVEHRFKLDQLRSVPVLRHFTDEELAYVAEHMETLEVKEGEFLYQVREFDAAVQRATWGLSPSSQRLRRKWISEMETLCW